MISNYFLDFSEFDFSIFSAYSEIFVFFNFFFLLCSNIPEASEDEIDDDDAEQTIMMQR